MNNTPAFQYYPNDLLADPVMMHWDMASLGAYWKLLSYLWVCGGQTQFDLKMLRRLFNVNKQTKAKQLWNNIKVKFVERDGIITHQGLLDKMQQQREYRLKKQQAGKKGAQKRWGNDGNGIDLSLVRNGSSSSSSPSISDIDNNDNSEGLITFAKPTPEEVTMYARTIGYELDGRRFCDYYEAKDWKLGRNMMTSWRAAVRVWKENDNHARNTTSTGNKKQKAGSGHKHDGSQTDWQSIKSGRG